jgi:tRNA threonylcarbamoyl adenosine modification protein YeaZ
MWVLAIDTSSAAVQSAVVSVDGSTDGVVDGSTDGVVDGSVDVRSEAVTVNARAHGEVLALGISRCLDEAGLDPAELGAVVAGLGPGPFTGLRVGLVTAAVLSDTLGIPSYGVCSLDAMAGPQPSLLVATDARRREVYWARYEHGVRVAGPEVARAADLNLTGVTAVVGAGARLYADVLGRPLLSGDYPQLDRLVELAAERIRARAPTEVLTPLYLRRPDAVEPGRPKAVLPP